MRTYRPDHNQAAIIRALKNAGASVCNLAAVGAGCPDLLVGWNGSNILLEVKNPDGRGMRFTEPERKFADTWRGRVLVVTSELEALEALTGEDV